MRSAAKFEVSLAWDGDVTNFHHVGTGDAS